MDDPTRSNARQRQKRGSPYSPLPENHIRLLRICRNSAGSLSNFDIRTQIHALGDETLYTALSYCWGPAFVDRPVTLDGQNECPLRARLNLWHFLDAITGSPETSNTLFWIDAISINQADLQERSEQVQLMPQIYSGAHRVLIWLGPEEKDSNRAMRCLQKVQTLGVPKALERLWATTAGAAFANLCWRPYWSRLWVVQEIVLGHRLEMMCGTYSISWQTIQDIHQLMVDDLCDYISKNRMAYRRTLNSPGFAMARRLANREKPSSLMSLVLDTSDLQCAERSDKVFALLGLSTSNLRADYTVSIPALLHAILSEHYTVHPVESAEQFKTVCKKLCQRLTQSESTIFELPATRFVGSPLVPMPREQCMCSLHYLKHGQAVIRAEPSACWIEAHEHYWMIEHLFALEDRAPDELMTLIFASGCPIAIRWLVESVAFVVADEASHYRQWISWASRVNLVGFVRYLLEHRERSFTSYASKHVGHGDIDSLCEALAAPVDLVEQLIMWLRVHLCEHNLFLYPSLRHAAPQDHTSAATRHEVSYVAAQADSGPSPLTYAMSNTQMDQVGLLPRHDPSDCYLNLDFDAIPILCVTDKDHPEVIKGVYMINGRSALVRPQQLRALSSHFIGRSLPHEMTVILKDTNIDQSTRLGRTLLEHLVNLGDVKIFQSVLKQTRVKELASPDPVRILYELKRYEMLEELEKAYEAAMETIVMRSLKLESPPASSEIEDVRHLWALILNKWGARARVRYREDYFTVPSSRFRAHSAIRNAIGVAKRLNISVLELGSDLYGRTPLHYAVLDSEPWWFGPPYHHLHADASDVRAIISSGAQRINVADEAGHTALFHALARSNKTIASVLLANEAVQIGDAITRVLWDLSPTPRPMLDGRFDPRQSLAQMGEKDWDDLQYTLKTALAEHDAFLFSDLQAIDIKNPAEQYAGSDSWFEGDDTASEGDDMGPDGDDTGLEGDDPDMNQIRLDVLRLCRYQ